MQDFGIKVCPVQPDEISVFLAYPVKDHLALEGTLKLAFENIEKIDHLANAGVKFDFEHVRPQEVESREKLGFFLSCRGRCG